MSLEYGYQDPSVLLTRFFISLNLALFSGPASKLVLKFFIALWCGSIGALFTFPGLRIARMHWDALRYSDGGPTTVLLHSTFISPLLVNILLSN